MESVSADLDNVAVDVASEEQLAQRVGGGAVPLPPPAPISQLSSQAAAVPVVSPRGANSTNDTARAQMETPGAAGAALGENGSSLLSTQQVTAINAGQGLGEQHAGTMSLAMPTPPVSAVTPATQTFAPAMLAAEATTLPALDHPLTDGRWNSAFGQRIVWALGQGVQSATLTLNPAELGPVTVQIAVHEEQARLQFTAAHGLTRDAIEAALPRLREMLQASGLSLGQVDISSDSQAGAGHNGSQQQDSGNITDSSRQDQDESMPASPVTEYTSRGLVDTFV